MKTKTKVILITAAVTVASFSLSGMLAKTYGEGKMTKYFEDVANQSFNHKDIETFYTEESLATEKVNEIQINSTEVDLKIEKSSDDKIRLLYSKSAKNKLSDLIHINGLVMKIDLDELKRQGPWVRFNFTKPEENFGITATEQFVKIFVPENIKIIKIKTVSGDVRVVNLDLQQLKLDSVSGDISVESSKITDLQQDTISGDINFQGSAKDIKAKTISGDFLVKSDLDNPTIKFSTTSGNVHAVFKSEPNVNFKFETVSGEVTYSKSLARTEINGDFKDLKFGKGEGLFQVQSTSGDVEIEKY